MAHVGAQVLDAGVRIADSAGESSVWVIGRWGCRFRLVDDGVKHPRVVCVDDFFEEVDSEVFERV